VQDAAELGNKLIAAQGPQANTDEAPTTEKARGPKPAVDEDQAIRQFVADLKPEPRRLLGALVRYPDGINGDDLARELGIATRQFGGLLGSISKNANKAGIRAKQLLVSEMRHEGPRRFRFLKPKALLLRCASKIEPQPELRIAG
jgi:hypothetical protein